MRARDLLREEGRISLRALRREFDLDDEALDELVEELVDVQQVAARTRKSPSVAGVAGVPKVPSTRPDLPVAKAPSFLALDPAGEASQ